MSTTSTTTQHRRTGQKIDFIDFLNRPHRFRRQASFSGDAAPPQQWLHCTAFCGILLIHLHYHEPPFLTMNVYEWHCHNLSKHVLPAHTVGRRCALLKDAARLAASVARVVYRTSGRRGTAAQHTTQTCARLSPVDDRTISTRDRVTLAEQLRRAGAVCCVVRMPPDARAHMQAGRCCVIENHTRAENVELDLLSVKATRVFDYLLQDPQLYSMKAERARTDTAGKDERTLTGGTILFFGWRFCSFLGEFRSN